MSGQMPGWWPCPAPERSAPSAAARPPSAGSAQPRRWATRPAGTTAVVATQVRTTSGRTTSARSPEPRRGSFEATAKDLSPTLLTDGWLTARPNCQAPVSPQSGGLDFAIRMVRSLRQRVLSAGCPRRQDDPVGRWLGGGPGGDGTVPQWRSWPITSRLSRCRASGSR